MAIRPDYDIGTVMLTSGSSDFTTAGASLQTAAVQAGDAIITPSGHVLIIATITGQNSGTLFLSCPSAAAGTGLALRIRFQPDGSRYQGAVRNLIDLLSSGNLEAFAGLVGANGMVPIFTGPGTLDLADPATFGIQDPHGVLAAFSNASSATVQNSSLLGVTSSGGIIPISMVTPEMFGAVGDGVTDDTAALANFFSNSTKTGYLPSSSVYLVTGTNNIPSGFSLVSGGATIKTSSTNLIMLRTFNTSDVSITGRLIVKGSGKANGSSVGLRLGGNSRCYFDGITFRDIDGWGILVSGGNYDAVSWYDKNQYSNLSAFNCYIGREDTGNSGGVLSNEYSTWMNFVAGGCAIGNKTSAGNNSFIGGKLIGNDYNLSIAPGENSAHGTITGVQINHANIDNVVCVSATSGVTFAGCTFFGDSASVGALRFANSRGIILSGCLVEASIFSDGAGSSIIIDGYYNNKNFAQTIGGANPETIFLRNGFSPDGRHSLSEEGYDYVSAYRSSNLSLTSGTDTVIVYDTISNNRNYRKKYNASNGQYTAPWNGIYRITASMKLIGTVTSGGIKIKRGTGDIAYSGVTDYSGVKLATVTADVFCNAGDVITAVANVTGTSLNISPAPNANLTIHAL